jgi:hypothetical protein
VSAVGETAHGMADAAAEMDEQVAALRQIRHRRLAHRSGQAREPGIELRPRHGDHVEGHQRVLGAAVLGALTTVDARPIGLDHHAIGSARDHVGLAGEARHPEGMDDVGRAEQQLDRRRGRPEPVGPLAGHLPPVHVPCDLHREAVRSGGRARLLARAEDKGNEGGHRHARERHPSAPQEQHLVDAARAPPQKGHEHQHRHEQRHHSRTDVHHDPEPVQRVRDRPCGIKRGLRPVAGCEQQA